MPGNSFKGMLSPLDLEIFFTVALKIYGEIW